MIAVSTFLLTLAGGAGAWLIDREDFDRVGDALWWAMQTVTTVGYGDVVPEHMTGRLIGVVLMLQGIALLTVITASVTATLIEQARRRRSQPDAVLAKLEQVEARLESIEQRLSGRAGTARQVSRTQRNPVLPVVESGVSELRADTR